MLLGLLSLQEKRNIGGRSVLEVDADVRGPEGRALGTPSSASAPNFEPEAPLFVQSRALRAQAVAGMSSEPRSGHRAGSCTTSVRRPSGSRPPRRAAQAAKLVLDGRFGRELRQASFGELLREHLGIEDWGWSPGSTAVVPAAAAAAAAVAEEALAVTAGAASGAAKSQPRNGSTKCLDVGDLAPTSAPDRSQIDLG